jgi:dihydroorotase-like cyclic amidohydrolase
LQRAEDKAHCDFALFVGASVDNYGVISKMAPAAAGLKMYLNETFTTLTLKDLTVWREVRVRGSYSMNVEFAVLQDVTSSTFFHGLLHSAVSITTV